MKFERSNEIRTVECAPLRPSLEPILPLVHRDQANVDDRSKAATTGTGVYYNNTIIDVGRSDVTRRIATKQAGTQIRHAKRALRIKNGVTSTLKGAPRSPR